MEVSPMQSNQEQQDVDAEGVVLAAQVDDGGSTTSFAYSENTTRTVRRALQLGLTADELLDYSSRDERDMVRALANAIGFSLGEIELEYEADQASESGTGTGGAGILEEEWPYEHVQPGEVEQDLSAHEAKLLRQELEDLRSTIDEWSCDDCGDQKSVVWKPATDENLCRDCMGSEEATDQ